LADSSTHWVVAQTQQTEELPSSNVPAVVLGLVDKVDGRVSTFSTNNRSSYNGQEPDESLVTTSTADDFLLISKSTSLG